jgi:signal transduction histidine kinase
MQCYEIYMMMQVNNASSSDDLNSAPTFKPFKGPFSRWPCFSEAILATVVFLASVYVPSNNDNDHQLVFRDFSDVPIIVLFLLAVAAVSLFWRRSQPLFVLATTIVVMALIMVLGYSFDCFGVPIALYSVGRYESNDHLSQISVGTIGIVGLNMLIDNSAPLMGIGFSVLMLFLSWYFGRRIRARGEYLRLLQERAEQLEREKVNESLRAVAAERGRIARELHDVVAHQVSLMTVQAAAAKTVVELNPFKAIQAMDAVETAGRQALVELRHLLGVLRPVDNEQQLIPQPGLADVPQLVDGFLSAGLCVLYSVNSEHTNLSAGINLTIYRIVQEALTNVMKHAGGDVTAKVMIKIDAVAVNIEIEDNGKLKNDTNFGHTGYGIIGMRERVIMLGGRLEARPLENNGYLIRCHIPIEQDSLS